MVSRNNHLMRANRMNDKKHRFAVKRLSIGVVSVFVGSVFALSNQQAQAAEVDTEIPTAEQVDEVKASFSDVREIATLEDIETSEAVDQTIAAPVEEVEEETDVETEAIDEKAPAADAEVETDAEEVSESEETKEITAYANDDTDIEEEVNDDIADEAVIASEDLKAVIDTHFPRVKEYTYKGDYFQGAVNEFNVIAVNGQAVAPDVEFEQIDEKTAHYKMSILDEAKNINASLTVELAIDKNALKFKVIELQNHNDVVPGETIDDTTKLLETIAFPDYLISISNEEEGAHFDGAKMSVNTYQSGDRHFDINGEISNNDLGGYMYGFLTNGNTSAGVWTNSQYSFSSSYTNDYTRLTVAQQDANVGILASPYYYQRHHEGKVYDERTFNELPEAMVIFADDLNEDGTVDWQDGAIAYRDADGVNHPYGYESVPELVAYRISMNFGSQAQNPFLMALDNVKKIALHTDGLGQSVLLKGYGSEGHDSGHLNYADVGERMGGAEDLRFLIEKGKEWGARFGVHVNASETYPESQYFEPDRLRKDNNGNYAYGWNWLDQGININARYDLAYGRFDRFKDFNKVVGDDLDFVYVDVWGNGQSGDNNAWMTHQLAKELNDLGYRAAFEWGYAGEYDSTFQHWAADLTYGDYTFKGVNSDIARFIRNHEKDSWVGNYPQYGGAAYYPLLGGYDMKDFEGWQGRSDYAAYIHKLYEVNLPSKFIQHFKVVKWEKGSPLTFTFTEDGKEKKYDYTPDKHIVLKDDDGRVLDITRQSMDPSNEGFKKRTITLDARTVMDGDAYLIPWSWDASGETLENDKYYYFNLADGETTWTLPDEWANKEVYVYELTDTGKQNEQKITLDGTTLTLNLKKDTPYVVYSEPATDPEVVWSEGMHIVDQGFNSRNLDAWEIEGQTEKANIVNSQGDNPMLAMGDNTEFVSVSQKLTDLKPNTTYAIYTGVDNRSKANATITINTGEKVLSNQVGQSIGRNFIKAHAHNTNEATATVDNTSYFQNMYVYFTTGDNVDNVTVTLSREAGDGLTYFDDIRIMENDSKMFDGQHDTDADVQIFAQDFEDVAQGIFPFVIGNVEGVEDNRTHLAEFHEPYTQRGWNDKKISDVIDGKWSVKTNGLVGKDALVYQTVPETFRFEPGNEYTISFDYEAGADDAYAFVIGHAPYDYSKKASAAENADNMEVHNMKKTWGEGKDEQGHFEVTFTANENGVTWIGIVSTAKGVSSEEMEGTSGNIANFRSYKDFMLDNLQIELTEKALKTTGSLVQKITKSSKKILVTSLTLKVSRKNGSMMTTLITATKHSLMKNGLTILNNQLFMNNG